MHIARAYVAMSNRYAQLASCTSCSEVTRAGFKESMDYFRSILDELEKGCG